MSEIYLSGLFCYPIKSLGGTALPSAAVEQRGLRYDRRWMLVDAAGDFMTQRDFPRMALIAVSVADDGLRCTAPGMEPLAIPFHLDTPQAITVTVWQNVCAAHLVGVEATMWFSEFLDTPCRLVYMPDTTARAVEPEYAAPGDIVSFADGYPFLLIGEASLADLNERLEQPVPMNRFRPNLVISGATAFAEDGWRVIRVGALTFHLPKPCARCALPNIDQATGIVTGTEPLRTLARYRTRDHKTLFGQNAICATTGTLHVGDAITILANRES